MANQKTTSAAKKVAGGKPKAKKSSVASSATKTAKSPKKAAKKKVAAAKTPSAVAQTKKSKTQTLKKPSTSSAKIKAPAKKAATGKAVTASQPVMKPSPEERYRMVETAAYFIAEQYGFQGRSDDHWAAAEREVSAKLGQ